jgi:hypothetical protein
MSNESRAAFEAWAIGILGDNPTWRESSDCELAWAAWQASRKVALEQAAQAITEPIGYDNYTATAEAAMTIRNLK